MATLLLVTRISHLWQLAAPEQNCISFQTCNVAISGNPWAPILPKLIVLMLPKGAAEVWQLLDHYPEDAKNGIFQAARNGSET